MLLLGGTLFGVVIGLPLSLVAIIKMNVAVAYTIFSLVPLLVILISVLFMKMKVTFRIILFSITAIAGVIILTWRNSISF